MRHLLTAQLHLQHWEFLPTLLQLNDAHSQLSALSGGAATKEVGVIFVKVCHICGGVAMIKECVIFVEVPISRYVMTYGPV